MGVFSGLGDKLKHVFTKLTSRGKLDEYEIKQAMREIRIALLEADVNFNVVKDFVARISERAKGEEITKSVTPGQQVVKIVHDELVELMGAKNAKLDRVAQAAHGSHDVRFAGRGQDHDVRQARRTA